MIYLLDTNICIAIIRKKSPLAMARLRTCAVGDAVISAITFSELQVGAYKSRDPQLNLALLINFCAPLPVLPYDEIAGVSYGPLRAHLESGGISIGPLDTLIAAHALSLNLIMVTDNEREFRRVPNLKVENWTKS
ncbi:MAG TPA: type II toxin-antitoxin system VapC family toxin [Phycisphaerae bacterium]|jgi:tRNA(fMet)-specific endonuclease VapC